MHPHASRLGLLCAPLRKLPDYARFFRSIADLPGCPKCEVSVSCFGVSACSSRSSSCLLRSQVHDVRLPPITDIGLSERAGYKSDGPAALRRHFGWSNAEPRAVGPPPLIKLRNVRFPPIADLHQQD